MFFRELLNSKDENDFFFDCQNFSGFRRGHPSAKFEIFEKVEFLYDRGN